MAKLGIDSIEISNSGVTINGNHVGSMQLGNEMHIEHYGPDVDGDNLHAVTLTIFTQNLTVADQLNGGVKLTTSQEF